VIHIAGIGASAGGLEAMLSMFAGLRPTGQIAYVVAQHMAHDGHSELVARLIRRESTLPVILAGDAVKLQPDTVYMIPADRDGRVRSGMLILSDPNPNSISTPSVNVLFSSIAENSGTNAIGIVLSGAGSDGAAGCRAIKATCGLILVQDLADAKHTGMPSAVVDAGLADQTLPAELIGERLAELFPGTAPSTKTICRETTKPQPETGEPVLSLADHLELEQLLLHVLDVTGIDFSSYKEETLLRRLEKRKSLLGIATANEYQSLIRRQPNELKILQHLFLVSMSSFFRDISSFEVLERALATRVLDKKMAEPIRIWVPGCASGEEAYTLAIILFELLGENRGQHPVMITATDLNPEALELAQAGVYRQTAFKEMDVVLRDRYFIPRGQHFEVMPELKESIQFELRDVISGSPTTDLDLVSCRNLLIYMKSHLQDQLIKSFHQTLKPHGLLFLGQYESLSFAGNSLFAPLDHYHRLFCRRN
jgi:chemotaxis protein methyltransferase CheR/two-component system CheB/CheR fusion protein